MREIKLTRGYTALVDDEDFERITNFGSWFAVVSPHTVYAASNSRKHGFVYMHRLILGLTDKNARGDHRDHNGLNNARSNLRVCTVTENNRNRRLTKGKAYKGTYWRKDLRKWRAYIKLPTGKTKSLGAFADEREAATAYDVAARLYFGEFAHCNFPMESAV